MAYDIVFYSFEAEKIFENLNRGLELLLGSLPHVDRGMYRGRHLFRQKRKH